MHRAEDLLLAAQQNIARSRKLKSVTIAGDFRRGSELIKNLSLVAEAT